MIFSTSNIEVLFKLLESEDVVILNQALWIFGNISAENDDYIREYLLNNQLISKCCSIAKLNNNIQINENCLWIISLIIGVKKFSKNSQVS